MSKKDVSRSKDHESHGLRHRQAAPSVNWDQRASLSQKKVRLERVRMTQKSDEQRIRLESGKESLCRQSKIKRWKLAIERRCHKTVAEELPVMNELTGHQGQDEYIPDREKAQRQLAVSSDTSAAARCQVSHGSILAPVHLWGVWCGNDSRLRLRMYLASMAAYKTCNSSLRIVPSTRSWRLDYSSQ